MLANSTFMPALLSGQSEPSGKALNIANAVENIVIIITSRFSDLTEQTTPSENGWIVQGYNIDNT